MSDWTNIVEEYIDRNYEELAREFAEKEHIKFAEFCDKKFWSESNADMVGFNDDTK